MIGNGPLAESAPAADAAGIPDTPENPFELAAVWADRTRWPLLADRTVVTELHELAVMTTLADWLRRWTPIHIHGAIRLGASVPAVAAAAGVAPNRVRELWEPWAAGQVDMWTTSNPARRVGLDPDERDLVRAVLNAYDQAADRGTSETERGAAMTTNAGADPAIPGNALMTMAAGQGEPCLTRTFLLADPDAAVAASVRGVASTADARRGHPMTQRTITIEFDDHALGGYDDKHLAALWHLAQANPDDGFEHRAPGEIAVRIGFEIIRRWLATAPVELYRHQGRHYHWKQLTKFAQYEPGDEAGTEWDTGRWVPHGDTNDSMGGDQAASEPAQGGAQS